MYCDSSNVLIRDLLPSIVAVVVVFIGWYAQWRVSVGKHSYEVRQAWDVSLRTLVSKFVSLTHSVAQSEQQFIYAADDRDDKSIIKEVNITRVKQFQVAAELRLLLNVDFPSERRLMEATQKAVEFLEKSREFDVDTWGPYLASIEEAARNLLNTDVRKRERFSSKSYWKKALDKCRDIATKRR